MSLGLGSSRNSSRNEIFLSFFFGLSRPGLSRNEPRMMFLNFFAIFWGMLQPGSGGNGTQNKSFFSSFSVGHGPILLEMKPKWFFFLYYFFKICLGMLQPGSGWNDSQNENFLFVKWPKYSLTSKMVENILKPKNDHNTPETTFFFFRMNATNFY